MKHLPKSNQNSQNQQSLPCLMSTQTLKSQPMPHPMDLGPSSCRITTVPGNRHRVMSNTERRYAQVEKEALAITWACKKFSNYILGKTFTIETYHKPLVPLLGTKNLELPES